MEKGDRVLHPVFGPGTVMLSQGDSIVVRFEHGIEECETKNIRPVAAPIEALTRGEWDSPLEVVNRAQALAIRSANDSWGVFSRSRIELLPHQLWVCRTVNQQWPARWLVADDVGLGKTIEAGMIVWPLLSRGTVKRLLILCPASLVGQWTYRLRTMFDIRLATYATEADTQRADFWGTHNQVVASLQTLRMENEERQRRLIESDAWDLVLVDEAHHLSADEQDGPTLGYKLVKRLNDEGRVRSMVFFTGTPHRGKNFQFFALLHLLRPDLFDPREPVAVQMSRLSSVMIRNNKSTVTDLKGNKLFTKPIVTSETYSFSPAEDRFYKLITKFILDGQAYASTLSQRDSQAVILVLIAMQKLASSSVAAIRRALDGRLNRLREKRDAVEEIRKTLAQYREADIVGMEDELSRVEEELPIREAALKLVENEETSLRILLSAADSVAVETKIQKIVDVLDDRFPGRNVLFFTEYKATQSLLMSALMARFGVDCVTFINGDDVAAGVKLPDGEEVSLRLPREEAAQRFNDGRVRFLIATEAGGEGIDLQERCHSLVHVDLPWNPMRLHQRVGRLNRYGQKNTVEVMTIRNPDTVESLIWEKLNEKLERITVALGQVMAEPEDMLQMVLGMTSPAYFRELFAGAARENRDSVDRWFDEKSASFGGKDIVKAVTDLVGHSAKFDFRRVADRLPRVDLPDLRSFLLGSLALNGRRAKEDEEGISFLTPETWQTEPSVRHEYRGMRFDRSDRSPDAAKRLLGVGHAVVDQALKQARNRAASVTTVPADVMAKPLFVFEVRDRVTEHSETGRSLVAGVVIDGSVAVVIKDWEVLRMLNELPLRRAFVTPPAPAPQSPHEVEVALLQAESALKSKLASLDEDFRIPESELCAIIWPRSPQVGDGAEAGISDVANM